MNNTQPTRIMPLLITALIVIVIAGIVLAAIGADSLTTLIEGVAIILASIVVFAWVISTPVVKMGETFQKGQAEANRHEEAMVKAGVWRPRLGYERMEQITAPAPDPETEKRKRLAQVNFVSNDPITLSVNLVLYSMIENGNESNKICGMPIPGCSGRAWQLAVDYLKEHYEIVSTRGTGGGTFVPEKIGTLKALYGAMAVNALPGIER